MSNETVTEVHVVPTGQTTTSQIVMHNTWGVNAVAQFAIELIKHSVMGPASAQNPAVLVERCVDIADLTFKKFEEKGWILKMPTWAELNEPTQRPGFVDHG